MLLGPSCFKVWKASGVAWSVLMVLKFANTCVAD